MDGLRILGIQEVSQLSTCLDGDGPILLPFRCQVCLVDCVRAVDKDYLALVFALETYPVRMICLLLVGKWLVNASRHMPTPAVWLP